MWSCTILAYVSGTLSTTELTTSLTQEGIPSIVDSHSPGQEIAWYRGIQTFIASL
jgi:hypothetical protein